MAEEESELELDRLQEELERVFNTGASGEHGLQSRSYCARFCELVEDHTSLWQVPLPQLQVLRSALCAFVRGAAFFPSDCEHVRYTLSSLALSVFELLLFFGKDEFPEDPLKDILDSFQECHSSLVRYQNVYLLQVRQIIKDGGPWASPVLLGILKELEQPQEEVDRYLSSEVSVFFEFRVRYLLACERYPEAIALAQRCSQHPTAGKHLYFKQAYLSCLRRTSQVDRLSKEMAEIDAKEAVEILCIAENEEKDELLLDLSRGFLLQQLRSGDMYYLWNLVFIWCKLYLRVKASKQDFLKECKVMILTAINIKAMFPFMKVILEEGLGRDGLTFCVELCARALQTDLKNDPETKSLLYKMIAYLLPSDLEICRACALLVFFLERTVEAYKTVFLLYTHPDQEYHLDNSPIGNDVRFEVIQILKKGLFFDPEFWSLLNIKTNCLKLMSDKVAKATLCEIMEEDKWVPNYCARGQCKCHTESERTFVKPAVKPVCTDRHELEKEDRRVRSPDDQSSNVLPPKRRGRKPGSQITKDLDPFPVRRSFRQLDLAQNHARQLNARRQRFLTRQTDKNTLKRRGRKPRWLLEELAAQAENSAPRQGKKPGRKPKQLNIQKGIAVDTPVIEITMELSYPDNEVDLSTDVQCLSTMTSTTSDESISPCRRSSSSPSSSNSPCQVLSQEVAYSWVENAKATEEFAFWVQESIVYTRKFHTYAKVSEDEGTSGCVQGDDSVVTASHAVEQERRLEAPTPSENPNSDPVKANAVFKTEVTSLTPTVTQFVSKPLEGTVDANEAPVLQKIPRQDSSSLTPVKDFVGIPETIVNTLGHGTSDLGSDASKSVSDIITTHENALEIAADKFHSSDNALNSSRSICPSESGLQKAMDNVSLSAKTPETTAHTTPSTLNALRIKAETISTPEKRPGGLEIASFSTKVVTNVSENAAAIPLSPKKAQETVVHRALRTTPSVNNSSSPVPNPQTAVPLIHKCKLCNKECRNSSIMRHAFLHYRLERKCMFCQRVICIRGPLCHFKMHIKKLRDIAGHVEEKKCEASPEQPAKTGETVQTAVPKKARPGLAQIKSKLLMRLNFRRESTAQKAEKSTDDGGQLKSSPTKKPVATQERNDEESTDENTEENPAEKKIIYLTRGLVRKSESKGRFLRKRLARKAKTRMAEKDVPPKDGATHRLNGVIWKKRKMKHIQGVRNHSQVTAKQENKEEKTEKMRPEDGDEVNAAKQDGNVKGDRTGGTNAEEKSLNLSKSEAKEKLLQKSGVKKKTGPADQMDDAKTIKKRKLNIATDEQTQNKRNPATKPTEQQENAEAGVGNGTESESNDASQPGHKDKKQMRATPQVVKCPLESCTFHGRPGPVLSHVLIHHPGDTNALEFFYNFAKQKCIFCSRRIWTPQHFFDHVISHRGNLKHPCYHFDCKLRFKTRLDLGDHMLKGHDPLKAVCCFPACTVYVSNPKELYSHEREHYKVARTKSPSKKDKSATSNVVPVNKSADQSTCQPAASPKSSPEGTQPEGVEIASPQMQSLKDTEQDKSATPGKVEDEMPLTLNKGSVNYTSKSLKLVNGHSDHEQQAPAKPPALTPKEQEAENKVSIKPFVRPPPSAYLDELFISMPKRWKGPQVSSKGHNASVEPPVKRQICPRCSASFNSEDELQGHREKCTSLFGFDSDDESAS